MVEVKLSAEVVAGRGKASTIIRDHSDAIRTVISGPPFPGSLNLILSKPLRFNRNNVHYFDSGKRLLVPGSIDGRPIWFYRWSSAPLHVVEVISTEKLRDVIGVRDGSCVSVALDDFYVEKIPVASKISWTLLWGGRRKWFYTRQRYVRGLRWVSRLGGAGQEGFLSWLKLIRKFHERAF